MGDTMTTLVRDLRAQPYSVERAKMECRAAQGYYHDFDTPLPAPKIQLVADLRALGFEGLARAAMDGAYDDESPTVEQAEELRAEVGPELYDSLFGSRGQPS